MNIALYLVDKIVNFRLPNDISGSFSFGIGEDDNKLINIEARNGKWVLYQTKEVGVIINNSYVSEIPLTPNTFYILRKEEKNYLIYVSEAKSANIIAYKYSTNLNLIIGNNEQSNIKYNCPYLNRVLIQVNINNNQLVLQKQGNGVIYSNKISIKQNPFVIKVGDEIEIYGLRIIFLNGIIF